MAEAVTPARRAAVRLLGQVLVDKRLMSELTSLDWMQELAPADQARARRLAPETLRYLDRVDRVIKPKLRKAPPIYVENILRRGVYELLAEGAAPHGVVNDLVGLCASSKRHASYRGLVNAVLRNLGDDWTKLPVPRLPKWLRRPLMDAWGNSAIQSIESAHMGPVPIDLTVKSDPAGWADRLGGTVLPSRSVRLTQPGQISALEGYEDGAWWVQDAAAALPMRLLGDVAGMKVADLCAAPGGKTLQLAAAGAQVTAIDSSEARMVRVRENLERTKLEADVRVEDVFDHKGQYDAVLLDAPCSATGTLRRHPDLPQARDGSGITELIGLQQAMLSHALTLLRPGGRLVFATCSLIPDEGECHIEALLQDRPDLKVLRPDTEGLGLDPVWVSEEGGLRLRPDYWGPEGGMDGFYAACVQLPG